MDAQLDLVKEPEMPTSFSTVATPRPIRVAPHFGRDLVHQFVKYGFVAIIAYGCFQFCSRYFFQAVQVDGCSMAPTLANADRYLLNRWIYHVREPRSEEVVVLQDPVDQVYLVKRIVAKPGDRVYLKDGNIFVNGERLKETYLPRGTTTFGDPHYREQLWICGVNQYFVLGDNRGNSLDSRIFGAVPQKCILGLLML